MARHYDKRAARTLREGGSIVIRILLLVLVAASVPSASSSVRGVVVDEDGNAARLSYPQGAVVIGILVETPQGSYLRQSCRDTLRSGDHFWPNAIALEAYTGPSYFLAGGSSVVPHSARPSNEALDPRDREANWTAFYGRLE
jgi:hypothetical protein